MVESLKGAPPRITAQPESVCNHYWDIEPPDGPTSIGICRHCGTQDEFSNVEPPGSFEDRTDRTFLYGLNTRKDPNLDSFDE